MGYEIIIRWKWQANIIYTRTNMEQLLGIPGVQAATGTNGFSGLRYFGYS